MKTSARGIYAIASHEGIVPGPYLDQVGVWTFGIGHTAAAGAPDPARMPRGVPDGSLDAVMPEVFKVFAKDLVKFEDRVSAAVVVTVAQHEFDALVSFDFNTGGIYRAQLTGHLNRGDRVKAAAGFMGWLKPESIRGRRGEEMRLFREGAYPGKRVPIWDIDSSNKPGRPIGSLSAEDVAKWVAQTLSAPVTPETEPMRTMRLEERLAALEASAADVVARLDQLEAKG